MNSPDLAGQQWRAAEADALPPVRAVIGIDDIARAIVALREARPDVWVSADGLSRIREDDAATMIGIATRTLRQRREEGRGPAYHLIGPRPTYAVGDVLTWLRTRRHDPRE